MVSPFVARSLSIGVACVLVGACARQVAIPPNPINRAAPAPEPTSVANVASRAWEDSSAVGPEAEIYRTWLRYLASKGGHYSRGAFVPSSYWLPSEQQLWRVYDLAAYYLPDSAVPEVLSIRPELGFDGEYRVVTRFQSDNDNNAMRSRTVTVTVFALRSGNGLVLANALPRLTRAWRRETTGTITYVMEPDYPFDRARAERAAAFVDSLASALDVPRLEHLMYYLASSEDDVARILGLETPNKWGPVGGLAQPTNHQLFSGIPALGENYRHELTHMVILPLMGSTTYFVSEGVPTWLGGTTGMDFATAARGLATFLRQHPNVALDSILSGHYPVAQFYPAGAVFVKLVYDQGGTNAVKALFDCGPSLQDFRTAVEHLLGRPWASVAADWHQLVLSFAPEN